MEQDKTITEAAVVGDNVKEISRVAGAMPTGTREQQLELENLELRQQLATQRRSPQQLVSELMLDQSAFHRVMETAGMLAKSGISKVSKPEVLAAKILVGLERGLSPMTAIQGVDIIEGNVSMRGALVLQLIQDRAKGAVCELVTDPRNDPEGHTKFATWRMGRTPDKTQEFSFGRADAERAKLISKNTYTAWAPDMYVWRAFARGARTTFQDVMGGAYLYEEMTHQVEGTAEFRAVQQNRELETLIPEVRALLNTIRSEWRSDYPDAGDDKADRTIESIRRRALENEVGRSDADWSDLSVAGARNLKLAFEATITKMRAARAERERQRTAEHYEPGHPADE